MGRYRVLDEIGIGGMGRVHLASVEGPGGFLKWVAIKRIHRHLITDPSAVQMFFDEACLAARISHPNVATVIDLGEDDEGYFIAMEYLHGEPLREIVRRAEDHGRRVPYDVACRILTDAAEGLHAAHELTDGAGHRLNVVHRDVSPHNLFVTYDGITKVVDFGIAKFRSRVTTTNAAELRGKLAYMSPEQVRGETIDRRSDVFALGIVAWELTTGHRLFAAGHEGTIVMKIHGGDVPPPSSIVPDYPRELEAVVMRALAPDRAQRYATARDLARALQMMMLVRGTLVSRDDVATYLRALLPDRIERRDDRLRALTTDESGDDDCPTIVSPSHAQTLTDPTRRFDATSTDSPEEKPCVSYS